MEKRHITFSTRIPLLWKYTGHYTVIKASKNVLCPKERKLFGNTLWVESLSDSADTQLSLLRRHRSHSPGRLFLLSLVAAEDGWSRFFLSKAGQLIQQWWLPCKFWIAQSPCRLLNENNFHFRCTVGRVNTLKFAWDRISVIHCLLLG